MMTPRVNGTQTRPPPTTAWRLLIPSDPELCQGEGRGLGKGEAWGGEREGGGEGNWVCRKCFDIYTARDVLLMRLMMRVVIIRRVGGDASQVIGSDELGCEENYST